jgi:transcriptional regulator with XRE-family HTH domain
VAVARTVKKSGPHPVEVHVGSRVRLRRTLMGMSQDKMAKALGLTFQQVQKYERGMNRIGSSRLYHLSQILDVPVSFFFDEMPNEVAAEGGGRGMSDADQDLYRPDTMPKRETLELVRAYYRIPDDRLRRKVYELVKAAGPKDD